MFQSSLLYSLEREFITPLLNCVAWKNSWPVYVDNLAKAKNLGWDN